MSVKTKFLESISTEAASQDRAFLRQGRFATKHDWPRRVDRGPLASATCLIQLAWTMNAITAMGRR